MQITRCTFESYAHVGASENVQKKLFIIHMPAKKDELFISYLLKYHSTFDQLQAKHPKALLRSEH